MHDTAQARGDGGGFGIPLVGVADKGNVGLQIRLARFQKGIERGRADFLLAFQQDGNGKGRPALVHLHPGTQSFQKGEQLTLVISSPPGIDAGAPIGTGADLGLEGIAVPGLARFHGLHVVMTVEKNVRRGMHGIHRMRQHDRMTTGFLNGRLQSHVSKHFRQPLCRAAAVFGMGRVGGYGGHAQKLKPALHAGVQSLIDRGKNGVQSRHERISGLESRKVNM